MGYIALAIATLLYFITAIDRFIKSDYPHGWLWIFYALANMCLMWAIFEKDTT